MASKTKYLRVERVGPEESWLSAPGMLTVPPEEIRSVLGNGNGYTGASSARAFAAKLLATAEAAEAAEAAITSRWRR